MNFTAISQLDYTFLFYATQLVFIYSFFFLHLFHHSPSLSCFFPLVYCMTLLTPTFICLCAKKRRALFFPACCVVSDSFLSPPCVLCLLSHQWNIEESTEHVSNPHVCCWVVLQGRLLYPLQFGGVFVDYELCVCLFLCVPCL